MLNFILGACGTGKTELLIEKMKDTLNKGKKCLVVVPDQFSFEYDKKMYSKLGAKAFNSVDAFSFSRLTHDIFLKFGGLPGEYADDITKTAVMYLAIKEAKKEKEFEFYNRQYKNPAFLNSILEIIKEFRWSDISPEKLSERLSALSGDVCNKTNDILSIYKSYEKLLAESGKKDSLNDNTEAAKVALSNGYFRNKNVFIDEFQSFSKSELNMLDVIISSADSLSITLPLGDNSKLFDVTNDTYKKLSDISRAYNKPVNIIKLDKQYKYASDDIAFLSRELFSPERKKPVISDNVKIYEASDVYSEADLISAEIRRLVKNNKYKFGEIAVVSRKTENYASILEASFLRYDIPFFMDFQKPVIHKSIMLFVKSVFEIASQKNPSTESVLRYAKTGLAGCSYTDISRLENYAYQWNIDGKLWLEPFPVNENDTVIEETRKKLIEPVMHFRKKAHNSDGQAVCRALYSLFEEVGTEKNIFSEFAENQENDIEVLRESKQLWNIFIDILDKLYQLIGENNISISEFWSILNIMLSESHFATPPQTLDTVIVSNTERARLNSPKAVFIIGANEGQFPSAVKQNGLFNERDRAQLKESGISLEVNILNKTNVERFVCYTSLSAPTEKLYITYPLSDASGKTQYPSYLISKMQSLFKNNIFYKIAELNPIYFCMTKKAAYYTYVQGFKRKDENYVAIRVFLETDSFYKDKLEYFDKLNFEADEKINSPELVKKLFGDKLYLSASRVEDYNKCPFIYFCKKGLNLYPLNRIEVNAVETGNVIHSCVYDLLQKFNKDEFVALSEQSLKDEISSSMNRYFEEKLGGDFAKSAKFIFSFRRIGDTLAEILKHIQEELSQSEFIPRDFELSISPSSDIKPLHLISDGKNDIYFTGKVDRADTCEIDGKTYLRIIDYKSGEKKFSLEDIYYGINMQMLLYLFTLSYGKGKYSGCQPAGVLYMPSKEVSLFSDRYGDEKEMINNKNKTYKMNGIVLDNEKVLMAMEKEVGGVFIPASFTKSGLSKNSSVINEKQLLRLKGYCEKLLCEMADSLYGGNISAVPLVNKNNIPCSYCDYQSICGKEKNDRMRVYDSDVSEKIEKILNGGEENG